MKPVKFLYHATFAENLPSIIEHGLLTKFYGAVHGSMDIHPPVGCVYLARDADSNNLNTALFEGGPVIVLKIDASKLDAENMWPDDCIYHLWAEEEILRTAGQVAKALGVGTSEGRAILRQLETATDEELPNLFKPFWRWYLNNPTGGEVAYSGDISPDAIVDVQPHPSSPDALATHRAPGQPARR